MMDAYRHFWNSYCKHWYGQLIADEYSPAGSSPYEPINSLKQVAICCHSQCLLAFPFPFGNFSLPMNMPVVFKALV